MRLFVASALPSVDGAFYARLVDHLAAKTGVAIRPVPSGSAHITHAFLGEVADDDVARVVRAMTGALESKPVLDVELGVPDVLMARSGPRAVIVPLTRGAAELHRLGVDLTFALRAVSTLSSLPMPKPPHVTIARFGRSATRRDGQRISEELKHVRAKGRPLRVERIQLMSSRLTPDGPVYEELASATLSVR
jgi:2'-5' RNA ligase